MDESGSTSVNALLAKMESEHKGMPKSAIESMLQDKDILATLTSPSVAVKAAASAMREKPDGEVAAAWLESLDDKEQGQAMPKLKVIATTAKLIDMIPTNMRGQIENMVGNLKTPTSGGPGAATGGGPGVATGNAGGASRAMDMINQVMNSGMLQQMQDMAKDDADDMETLKEDVKRLKGEVEVMKKLVQSIVQKLPNLKGKRAKK